MIITYWVFIKINSIIYYFLNALWTLLHHHFYNGCVAQTVARNKCIVDVVGITICLINYNSHPALCIFSIRFFFVRLGYNTDFSVCCCL
jgi:hypothetical protein